MFTSASAVDPSFWPLHGASERLLALKRIYRSKGLYSRFDDTWDFPTFDEERSLYVQGVCDWTNVTSAEDLTLPTCDPSASCDGHGENDMIDFRNFLGKNESYTNKQFLLFMHPWNVNLPYTFDSFSYDYCLTEGVIFV